MDVATSILVSEISSGDIYIDPSCTISTGMIGINAGASSASFYFKSPAVEVALLSAIDAANLLQGAGASVTVDGATKLAFEGPATLNAGTCGVYRVVTQNNSGSAKNVKTAVTVNLTETGSGSFYSDTNCTTVVSTVSIAANTSFSFIRYKDNTVESVVLTAEDNAANLAMDTHDVTIDGAAKLALSGPSPILAGICNAYLVQAQNLAGAPRNVVAATPVTLTGAGAGAFYSNSTCTTASASVTIPINSSNATFYFKDPSIESVTFNAAATGLLTADLPVVVDGPSQLDLVGPAATVVGACTEYSIITRNAANAQVGVGGNVVVNLSGAMSGGFFSNSSCSTAATTVTFTAGQSERKFWFKDAVVETPTLAVADSAAVNPLTGDSLQVVVSGATKLSISGTTTIASATCASFQVKSLNASNVETAVGAQVTVLLSGGGVGTYYSNSSCTTSTGSVVIPANQSSATFYFKDLVVEMPVLQAADQANVLTAASLQISVGGPTKLAITGPSSLNVSQCGSYVVVSQNSSNVATNVGVATTVNLSDSGAGIFYSDSNCTTTIPGVTIAAGQSQASIWFKDATAETTVLSAVDAASLLTTGTLSVAVSGSATAGRPDTTFHGDGITTLTVQVTVGGVVYSSQYAVAQGVVIQSDGKIVVGGTVAHPYYGDYDFALARFNTNGALDTSFGSGGVVLTDFRAGDDVAYGLTQQADGKLVLVGLSQNSTGGNQSFALARYSASGTLDTSFSSDGMQLTFLGLGSLNNDEANAVVQDSSGKLVVVGRSGTKMIIARYNSSGSLDTTLGTTGVLSLAATSGYNSALAVTMQSDGKIVVTGYGADSSGSSAQIVTARFNSTGSLDSSFSGDGIQYSSTTGGFDMGRAVKIDSSGRIVVAGTRYSSSLGYYQMALIRYLTSGSADTAFDGDGLATTSLSKHGIADALVIQPDGKLVMAGYLTGSGDDFVVTRFSSVGAIETAFGSSGDGIARLSSNGQAHGVALDSSNKIVAVGEMVLSGESAHRIAVTRLLP